jgi:hypothetical protein
MTVSSSACCVTCCHYFPRILATSISLLISKFNVERGRGASTLLKDTAETESEVAVKKGEEKLGLVWRNRKKLVHSVMMNFLDSGVHAVSFLLLLTPAVELALTGWIE